PSSIFLFFHSSPHPLDLPSFPTRRSSDLRVTVGAAAIGIDPRRQQEPLTQRQEFFLREEAEVLHALPLLEHPDIGSRADDSQSRSEEHTSELQSLAYLVCRLLLEKKKKQT